MLYTVRPLERIYMKVEGSENNTTEQRVFETEHGHIFARRNQDSYVIDHIESTNMEDYLNEEYQPGSEYHP